jgi:alpha-mannosidase
MVYEDAEKLYAEVRKDALELAQDALRVLLPSSLPLDAQTRDKLTRDSLVFGYNTTFFPRMDLVKVPLDGNARVLGGSVLQTSKDGSEGYALLECSQGGSLSTLAELSASASGVTGTCPAALYDRLQT